MSPRPGPPRRPLNVRASDAELAAITARAARENGGNVSAWARRGLAYAVATMPPDWTPPSTR